MHTRTAQSRIAVLVSGRGSNLRALLDHLDRIDPRATGSGVVVLVASDRPDVGALTLARERAIEAVVLDTDPAHGDTLARLLRGHSIDLVVLAGYVRLIPAAAARAFRGRIINVHPALLPAFSGTGMYGARVHRAVLASGARVSGATVHFVDEVYDRGAIIAQWPVPVFADDTEATLAARVLRAEHRLLPSVVQALADGRIQLDERNRARGTFETGSEHAAFALGDRSDDALAEDIARAITR